MTSTYKGVVVVVPTRNRAHIAVNAIRSVLDEEIENVYVLVSDNSTVESDREALAAFCASLDDARLRYVRPPQSFAMPEHWQWAIDHALSAYNADHFLYLTDRMMFKRGGLNEVIKLAALYPDKVISYNHDRIVDHVKPIRVEHYPATALLWEIPTERLSWLVSQSVFHHGLPRMLNCIVPRTILDRIRARFGNVFTSIAPDFNFCFRCLDVEDSILFLDRSPFFHYALSRSNGASVSRGEMTPDNADFTANLPVDDSIRNYATPIPQLNTTVNAVLNEYLIYKNETNSPRFFDLDFEKYLATNAMEVQEVTDPQLRAEMQALLEKHGYYDAHANQGLLQRARSAVRKLKTPVGLVGEISIKFSTVEDAIDYARTSSRMTPQSPDAVRELLHARELPT
ncbi:MAG TPA: glycosyltransferase [Pyrinomonadaceae bacterium]|nr:glycosyltransferase [Pyrinomonadaceae bacterium]